MTIEPCMCGDPYCPRCFDQHDYPDEDDRPRGFWISYYDEDTRTIKRRWAVFKRDVPVVPLVSSQWTDNDHHSLR